MNKRSFLLLGLLGLSLCVPLYATSDRVALVIGNNTYQNGAVLRNPINDARAIAGALKSSGFEVLMAEDAGLEAMEKMVVEFSRAAKEAKAAWFYYSGHGAEVKGSNYLIPVDAAVLEEFQVKHKTLALDQVLAAMDDAGTPLKVVVLDCCRDNPFGKSWSRSSSHGLAQIGETPRGTIIAFSTAPGKTAADGSGLNSPYTTALLAALATPGLDVDQVFKFAGRNVLAATHQRQQPWVNSSFFDSFVITSETNPPPPSGGGTHSGKDYLATNAKRPGIKVTASGLQYEIIRAAEGPKPNATDSVKVHYQGNLINGKLIDSSIERGEPVVFPVHGVIKGWTEALQLMPVGSKWKLFIPSELAYGKLGAGDDIRPDETLVFEVELLSIER